MLADRAISSYSNRDVNTVFNQPEGTKKERSCPGCMQNATPGKIVTVQVSCDECGTELCVPCDYKSHQEQEGAHRRAALPGVKLSEAQMKVLRTTAPKSKAVKPPQEYSAAELTIQEEEMNPNVMAVLRPGTRMVTAGDVMRNTVPNQPLPRTVTLTPGRIPQHQMEATSDEIARFMNTGPPGQPASDRHRWERSFTSDEAFTVETPVVEPTTIPRKVLVTNRKHNRPQFREEGMASTSIPMQAITTPRGTSPEVIVVRSPRRRNEDEAITDKVTSSPRLTTEEKMANYLAADDAVDLNAMRFPSPRINRSALQASANNQPVPSRLEMMPATKFVSPRVDPFHFDWNIDPNEPLFIQRYIAEDPNAPPEEPRDPNWSSANIMEGLTTNNPARTSTATVDGRPVNDPMSAYNEPHRGDKRKADGDGEPGQSTSGRKGSAKNTRPWRDAMTVIEEEEAEGEDQGMRMVEASGNGWTSSRDFRAKPSEATEAATDTICIRCRVLSDGWRCDCKHSGGNAVYRGLPGGLNEGANLFASREDSLPKEFAKLGDMLNTEALENIVGEEEGVVATAIDCEGWQGYFPTKVHEQFPNEELTGHMTKAKIERTFHDFCVQVAAVETYQGGRRTAFNIHFRIPEKAVPLIHTPAAHKTMQSLRVRVTVNGTKEEQNLHKEMDSAISIYRNSDRMAYMSRESTRTAIRYFNEVEHQPWAQTNAEGKDKTRGKISNPLVSGGISVADVTPITDRKMCAYQARMLFKNYEGDAKRLRTRPPRLYIVYDGNSDLATYLKSMPVYPDRIIDLVHLVHVKFIMAYLDFFAEKKDQGGELIPWSTGIRSCFTVQLPKLSELWEKVCRPSEQRLLEMSGSLHNAETDALITLEVWEATWEYRKRHRAIFDRHTCVNMDVRGYMNMLHAHRDKNGMIAPARSCKDKNMMLYKMHLSMVMCRNTTYGCRHRSAQSFPKAPEHTERHDESRKRSPDRDEEPRNSSSRTSTSTKTARTNQVAASRSGRH